MEYLKFVSDENLFAKTSLPEKSLPEIKREKLGSLVGAALKQLELGSEEFVILNRIKKRKEIYEFIKTEHEKSGYLEFTIKSVLKTYSKVYKK